MSIEDDLNNMIKDAAILCIDQQYKLTNVRLEYVNVLLYEARKIGNAFPINKYEYLLKHLEDTAERLTVIRNCQHNFTPVSAVCSTVRCSRCDFIYEV